MDKELQEKIDELVEELYPAKGAKESIVWNGFKVYEPIYEKNAFIGYPLVILVKDNNARISTPDESLDYLDYKDSLKSKYED